MFKNIVELILIFKDFFSDFRIIGNISFIVLLIVFVVGRFLSIVFRLVFFVEFVKLFCESLIPVYVLRVPCFRFCTILEVEWLFHVTVQCHLFVSANPDIRIIVLCKKSVRRFTVIASGKRICIAEHIELSRSLMINYPRCSVLVHDLACRFRFVFPVPEPLLKSFTLCLRIGLICSIFERKLFCIILRFFGYTAIDTWLTLCYSRVRGCVLSTELHFKRLFGKRILIF